MMGKNKNEKYTIYEYYLKFDFWYEKSAYMVYFSFLFFPIITGLYISTFPCFN